jgi:plastocyanin
MNEHPTYPARRFARAAVLSVIVVTGVASSVSAATTDVGVNDNRTFSPSRVTQAVGGRVHWAATGTDDHSVTHDNGVFNSGPASAGVDFTRTFSAGTFAYHCSEHGDQGMRGQVRIAPRVRSAPRGAAFTVQWATARTNTGNRFDVQYRVGRGPWRTWLRRTAARSAVFGNRSRPVRVRNGKTYSFRVVSRTSAGNSGVSPVRSFRG